MGAALQAEGAAPAGRHVTMIYVTHDQTEALTFADQVVVMHEGTGGADRHAGRTVRKPRHTFVGHFIGSPGMNLLPCEGRGRQARFARPDPDPWPPRACHRVTEPLSSRARGWRSAFGRSSSASPTDRHCRSRSSRSAMPAATASSRRARRHSDQAPGRRRRGAVPESRRACPLRSGPHPGLRRRLDGRGRREHEQDQPTKAWFFVLPVVICWWPSTR